jgi:hypothetical protein
VSISEEMEQMGIDTSLPELVITKVGERIIIIIKYT